MEFPKAYGSNKNEAFVEIIIGLKEENNYTYE